MESLTLVSGPALEPLTAAEIKKQIRMGSSAGEPSPSALTATLISPAAAGNVDNGGHRYGVTFVTADGETELGTISDLVTVSDKSVTGRVSLANIPIGGSFVTARKLYRTAAGGSVFLLLETIANNTATTYTDNIADASLGAQAPSVNSTANPQLLSWGQAAREIAETFTRRRFITQTVRWVRGRVPCGTEVVEFPFACVSAVTVSYVDANGVTQAFTDVQTQLPSGPKCGRGCIAPAYGFQWPSTRDVLEPMTFTLTAGYGASRADVPESIKTGMKALIGHWDANRQEVVTGTIATALPYGVKWAWMPFRSN